MRPRQRLRAHTSSIAGLLARVLVVLLALALIYYGAMVILLAAKVSSHTVDQISAYRTFYDDLASIAPATITATDRIITAIVGVIAFLVLGSLAVRDLPRPYRARRELTLEDDGPGASIIEPRAIERAAEAAAGERQGVIDARGRYSAGELRVDVDVLVDDPATIAATLTDIQGRVREVLERHDLPSQPVAITLTSLTEAPERTPA